MVDTDPAGTGSGDGTYDVPPPSTEPTSTLLRRILRDLHGDDVSIGYIVIQLRRRSFGGIFLVLAALGLLPGISFFAGLALLVPSTQLLLGYRAPILPRRVRRRRIGVAAIRALGARSIPWIERIERYVKPRWLPLSQSPVPQVVGLLSLGLSLVVMLPLPFSNFPPALALIFLSLGLMERDGAFLGVGAVLAVIALCVGGFVSVLAMQTLLLVVGN